MVSPNSCFTVIYLDPDEFNVTQVSLPGRFNSTMKEEFGDGYGIGKDKMKMSPRYDMDIDGIYLKMRISSPSPEDAIENHYRVEIYVFVTNTPIDPLGSRGYLGMGICPEPLRKDYSFRYNLARSIQEANETATEEDIERAYISSLEWIMNTTANNQGEPYMPNGFLYINQGHEISESESATGEMEPDSQMKALNDIPINSYDEEQKMNIKYTESNPPVISNVPYVYTFFNLGKTFTETRFAQSMTIQQDETRATYG